MSQPAARPLNRRRWPHDCPTCDAPAGRGCTVINPSIDRLLDRPLHTSEHVARRRLREVS